LDISNCIHQINAPNLTKLTIRNQSYQAKEYFISSTIKDLSLRFSGLLTEIPFIPNSVKSLHLEATRVSDSFSLSDIPTSIKYLTLEGQFAEALNTIQDSVEDIKLLPTFKI